MRVLIILFSFTPFPRTPKTIENADIILFEGILVLYYPEVRELLDMKVFVDLDSDTRLAKRGE